MPHVIHWRLRTIWRICLTLKCLFVGHRWHVIARDCNRRGEARLEVAICLCCGQSATRGGDA